MPDTDVQSMEASVEEEKSRETGDGRGGRSPAKDSGGAKAARPAGGGSGETAARGSTSSTPVLTSGLGAHSGKSQEIDCLNWHLRTELKSVTK